MNLEKSIAQLKLLLARLTPRQQLFLAAGGVVLAAAVWFFLHLINREDFAPLYSGLNSADAQALTQQLAAKGVSYQLSPDGSSVSVPTEKLDALRLEMAAEGVPESGRMGFELFDKPNWMGSDFSEKVNYQRALEGELERSIRTIETVESVRVHLVMPRESLFSEQERQAKAAVVVKLRRGKLGPEQAVAIANLVSSAVDQLPPERVSIVSADGRTPLVPAAGGDSEDKDLSGQLEDKLLATLTPIAGEGRIRATVFVEHNLSTSEKTQETYDPTTAVVLASQESEEQRGRSITTGVPGPASNVPAARTEESATALTRLPESQSARNATRNYAVNKTIEHVSQPAGAVKRVATAVLVDDFVAVETKDGKQSEKRRKRTAEEMQQIQQLARAAVGFDEARGDVLAVENVSFEVPAAAPEPEPTRVEQVLEITRQWRDAVRYGVVLLLFTLAYLIVLRPIKKQMVAALKSTMPPEPPPAGATAAKSEAAAGAGAALPAGATPAAALPGAPDAAAAIAVSQDEAISKQLKQLLVERVRKEPDNASRVIQNWIRQDDVSR